MKRLAILTVAVLVLSYGCAQKQSVMPGAITKTNTAVVSQTNMMQKDFLQIGFDLIENESIGELKIGMLAKDVEAYLGSDCVKNKPETWGADGLVHQGWSYKKKGVFIGMVIEGGKTNLSFITIFAPSTLTTKRGIGVGATTEQTLNAYRDEVEHFAETDYSIVAGSIYGGIVFGLDKGKVSSIFIGASAE